MHLSIVERSLDNRQNQIYLYVQIKYASLFYYSKYDWLYSEQNPHHIYRQFLSNKHITVLIDMY